MNRTHLEHAIYAVLMQSVIGLLTGNWWAGAAFGAAFFLGREHSQAEEAYLEYHRTSRSEVPLLEIRVLHSMEVWNMDAILDWVIPLITVTIIAYIAP